MRACYSTLHCYAASLGQMVADAAVLSNRIAVLFSLTESALSAQEMTAGTMFTGFFEQEGNVVKKPTFVFYEPGAASDPKDKGAFYWAFPRAKTEGNTLLLQQITDVFQGKKGPVRWLPAAHWQLTIDLVFFQIFAERGAETADATRTFALGSRKTTPNRTLNLEASTTAIREAWMNGLKEVSFHIHS
jgi:hypothetical protein